MLNVLWEGHKQQSSYLIFSIFYFYFIYHKSKFDIYIKWKFHPKENNIQLQKNYKHGSLKKYTIHPNPTLAERILKYWFIFNDVYLTWGMTWLGVTFSWLLRSTSTFILIQGSSWSAPLSHKKHSKPRLLTYIKENEHNYTLDTMEVKNKGINTFIF